MPVEMLPTMPQTPKPPDTPPNHQRRLLLAGGTAALVGAAVLGHRERATAHAASDPTRKLRALEKHIGGRIGLSALDTGSGARLEHRSDERFALCSTFKWLLAASVLARVDREGPTLLGRRLPYGAPDLLEYAPYAREHVAEGALTVDSLCRAAVEVSDNTAANLLLKFQGGPVALTSYLRSIGDAETRLDRIEPALNSNEAGDPRDTSTPRAMLETQRKLLLGDALSDGSRIRLTGWLKDCKTGLDRLRAGVPHDWIVGDKTGTGNRGSANDVAIFWPPHRAPVLAAAYLSDSSAPTPALNAVHAKLGHLVAATFA
jgi:beta-lactamase class A